MIKPDLWQSQFLETEGDKILCCGRQVGKSEICSMDAGEWSVNNPHSNVLMIAPTERQARALFDKTLDYLLSNYKTSVKKGKDRPTQTKITLTNGTKIYCLPTGISGLGIRFLTVHRLYVDEASRVPEDVWTAVNPMLLTTGGASIYLSTPAGAIGEFWRCWVNKDSAYSSFKRFSVTSEEVVSNREICDTWTIEQRTKALQKIEQAKARMSRHEYAQEYLGEFIEDLHRYFSDKLIKDTAVIKRPEGKLVPSMYFLGVDIARMGEDKSSFQVVEKRIIRGVSYLKHIESITTSKTLTTETEEKIIELDKIYNFQYIYIDAGAGSLGVSIFDHLLKNDSTKRKVVAINNRARPYDRDESAKARLLKEDLYDNLRSLMERGEIQLLDDDDLIECLRSIQYEYIQKEGRPTRMRIFAYPSADLVEALIRAVWCVKDKTNDPFILYSSQSRRYV